MAGRFSINQATIKHATLVDAVTVIAEAGLSSIGVWREPLGEVGARAGRRIIDDAGLSVSSLCRGGFFTAEEGNARTTALDDNRRALDEAATIGAPALVLVAGGLPDGSRDLIGARERVRDAVGDLADHADQVGVTLAIEPLHPMYAADRAVINTLAQALEIAESVGPAAGIVVDTFHVWWDPAVLDVISRAAGRIASYQVCDWILPLPADVLLGRGMMGDGFINFEPITRAVAEAGYNGDVEVEIFNEDVWNRNPTDVVRTCASRFETLIHPFLTTHAT
jgi:sugar phosphate isomerase/epimerase